MDWSRSHFSARSSDDRFQVGSSADLVSPIRLNGVVLVCSQRVGVGRACTRRTLIVVVSDPTLAIELDDGAAAVSAGSRQSPPLRSRPDRRGWISWRGNVAHQVSLDSCHG